MRLTIFYNEGEYNCLSFAKLDLLSDERPNDHIIILNTHNVVLLHLKNKNLSNVFNFDKFKMVGLKNHDSYFLPTSCLEELIGVTNDN